MTETFKKTPWGTETAAKFKDLPFVCKILDSTEGPLSVQVHPENLSSSQKANYGNKSEFWYVLSAEPNSQIYIGLDYGIEYMPAPILTKNIIESGEKLIEHMKVYSAKPGRMFVIPSGVIHCLGKGIRVFEIAQDCDITYRLYDFDRGRPLDIEEGLKHISFANIAGPSFRIA